MFYVCRKPNALTKNFRSKRLTTPVTTRRFSGRNPITRGDSLETRNRGRAEEYARRRRRHRAEAFNCRDNQKHTHRQHYIPNGTELWTDKFTFKLDWLQKLRKMFDETCDKNANVLLCGDFNVAPDERDVWNTALWEGRLHFSKPERAAIHHVKQWGFVDVFRQMNGDLRQFSWWDYRKEAFPKNQGLRIDHIWTSRTLADKCLDCWIDRTPRGWERPSDHTPVVAEFKV
jgi:exodeoxyribonuclease III